MHYDSAKGAMRQICRLDGEWAKRYGEILDIYSDRRGTVLVTRKGVLRHYDKARDQFTDCDGSFPEEFNSANRRLKFLRDSKGRKWLMYNSGLWFCDPSVGKWTRLLTISGASNFFTSMDIDVNDNVWLGASWSGLRVIDGKTLQIKEYPALPLENNQLLSNDIQHIYADDNGGVWIGTLWQGLCYYHERMHPFHTFHTGSAASQERTNESVRCMMEMPDGDILIGTSTNGVVGYDPATGSVEAYRPDLFPADDIYLCLYRDRDNALWVGTYLNGFVRLLPDGTTRRYNYLPEKSTNVSRAVYQDPTGRFWVSARDSGVGELNIETGEITPLYRRFPKVGFHKRDRGFLRYSDTEFIAFGEQGAFYYDTKTDSLYIPQLDGTGDERYFLSCNGAICDTRGLGWFATDDGVIIHDYSTSTTTRLTRENSLLPTNYVSTILEDSLGQIWVSTSGGLVRVTVRPSSEGGWGYDLTAYIYGNGLHAGRINENAALLASDGKIYLGAFNGVSVFDPRAISPREGREYPAPLLTSLTIGSDQIKPGMKYNGRVILDSPLFRNEEITLHHDENFIAIGFSALDFISGKQQQFRFRLKGYDRDWVEIDAGRRSQAVYTGIPPGEYEFEVYSAGMDGVWSTTPATLRIIIEPPFWATWWAYTIYAIVLILMAYFILKKYNAYKNRKMLDQAEKQEMLQRQRLNEMKFQFFTNISHEFRTPLALIMTPLSKLIQEESEDSPVKKKLKQMYGNAESLLGLVNRLLDFRRLEMGGEKLNLSRCRIVQYITYLATSFTDVAGSKGITLEVKSTIPEDTDIYLDTHKLRHILTNLFSNSIKFTPNGGRIDVAISGENEQGNSGRLSRVVVSVKDTGIGIPADKLPKIFERFYQVENSENNNPIGSGIGLHLVKSYVTLHKGDITVESHPGEGTTFTFSIPADLTKEDGEQESRTGDDTALAAADAPVAEGEGNAAANAQAGQKRPRLLVVEDNSEFREFLAEYLAPEYDVDAAVDGVDALAIIKKDMPDLIITDLMMPRLDGMGLIQKIKEDLTTSHIPVILLTAKASDETRIESYRLGADSYISKPFNFDILSTRVKMLLQQSQSRRNSFRRDAVIEPSAVTIAPIDEIIVKKALETVEANMDNSAFTAVQLGEALGLSRSQLYRKFETITGMSPADFILTMRLKRAAQLLRDSRLNVSEIADMTGFNSIKYFNKHFKEEFSMTPTEYRASCTK